MGDQDGYPCATLISEIMTAQTGDIPIGISLVGHVGNRQGRVVNAMRDTLAISERLKQAGLTEPVAKAIAMEIASRIEVQTATKADIREIVQAAFGHPRDGFSELRKELRNEMGELRKELCNEIDGLRQDVRRMMYLSLVVMALLLTVLGLVLKLIH